MQHPLELAEPDAEDPLKSLAERLAEGRRRSKLSQQDVADHCRVSVETLSRWERGCNEPGALHVAKVAELYGVATDWLLGLSNHPSGLPAGVSVVDQGAVDRIRDAAESGLTLRHIRDLMQPPGISCMWDIPTHPVVLQPAASRRLHTQLTEWVQKLRKKK